VSALSPEAQAEKQVFIEAWATLRAYVVIHAPDDVLNAMQVVYLELERLQEE
jgi:hypothetical protein